MPHDVQMSRNAFEEMVITNLNELEKVTDPLTRLAPLATHYERAPLVE
jgi:hypothetical protein